MAGSVTTACQALHSSGLTPACRLATSLKVHESNLDAGKVGVLSRRCAMHTTWRNSEDRTRSPTPNFTTFLLRYQPTFQLCEKSLSALTQSLLATLPSLGPWLEPPMLGGQSCEGLVSSATRTSGK